MITRTLSFLLISIVLTACSVFDPEANLKVKSNYGRRPRCTWMVVVI